MENPLDRERKDLKNKALERRACEHEAPNIIL